MRKMASLNKVAAMSLTLVLNAWSNTAMAADATTSTTGSPDYLQQIADNTYNILSAVNNIPTYLNDITQMAQSWLSPDSDPTTSFIAQTQGDFASLGYWFEQNKVTQNGMQVQMMANLMHQPVSSFTTPSSSPAILDKYTSVNDIAYSSLLGLPPVARGDLNTTNYINYAAGLNLYHITPSLSWPGNGRDITTYMDYFNTISAIESFDAYVLSSLAADNANGNPIATLQTSLTNQATSSSWLAQIATEELGKVLRQILVFQSQSYVLLTQQLQVQKQMVSAQAMTNSLLILNNYQNEVQLARKAQGIPPKA